MTDRKFAVARNWSNRELKQFAKLFTGSVVNASAWRDEDKEGGHYRNYFSEAKSYALTNFESEAMGFQGYDNEMFLDLTADLDPNLHGKFDTVFNHTTLEHIYEVHKAFANLCSLSNDIVIIVVPFLQQMHANYGDFWRFTPLTIKNMFEEQGMELLYLSYNNQRHSSVYLFAIASHKPKNWEGKIPRQFTFLAKTDVLDMLPPFVGCRAVTNTLLFRALNFPWLGKLRKKKSSKPEKCEENCGCK